MGQLSYGLFTSAKNEERHIAATIRSVVGQSLRPRLWVIASDASSDGTDRIIREWARRQPFIRYLRLEGGRGRDFRAKARALNLAARQVLEQGVEFLGNLDADITVAPGYYAALLERFAGRPRLGIAGGIVWEKIRGRFVPQNTSLNSVAGGVQTFRRECFAAVQPYTPMRFGGEDAVLEITARALGWDVQTFADLEVLHHRPVGSSFGNRLAARYRMGKVFRRLGYHPLFETLRCLSRLGDRPPLLAALAELAGYASSGGGGAGLPPKVLKFLRSEQLNRISGGRGHVRHLRSVS